MYKIIIALGFLICISKTLEGQNVANSYDKACDCISKIDIGIRKQQQLDEVVLCVKSVSRTTKIQAKLEHTKNSGISPTGSGLEDQLIVHCPSLKTILTTSFDISTIKKSINSKALKLYKKGLLSYRNGNNESAVKYLSKATDKDSRFTQAWNLLGLTYDRQGEYRKAGQAYSKSSEESPYGRISLLKKPQSYEKAGDNRRALLAYEYYVQLLPKDPEGYYKLGRKYHVAKEYEKALDNTMKAFILFKERDSPFTKDALVAITLLRNDLNKKSRMDIFNKYAEKYNLIIGG
jgi:outer membrane protein assembly factor BamD (BamD/ComL family)